MPQPLTRTSPQPKNTSHSAIFRRYQVPRAEVQYLRKPAEGGVVFGVFHLLLMLAGAALFIVLGLILFPVSTVLGLFAFGVVLAALVGAVRDIIRIAR